jgi:hypothetical protein
MRQHPNPSAHVLGVASVLTVLVVGLTTLFQATPSWWRVLLVPVVLLPAMTLRRPVGRLLAGHDDPWVDLALVPAPVPVPVPPPAATNVHQLRTSEALRFGHDSGVARAA